MGDQLTLLPERDKHGRLRSPFFPEEHARRALNLGGGWRLVRVEALGGYNALAMPDGTGKTRVTMWGPDGGRVTRTFRNADIAATRAEWERETGRCSECGGNGTTMASLNCVTGECTWRTCSVCDGTGTARVALDAGEADHAR